MRRGRVCDISYLPLRAKASGSTGFVLLMGNFVWGLLVMVISYLSRDWVSRFHRAYRFGLRPGFMCIFSSTNDQYEIGLNEARAI